MGLADDVDAAVQARMDRQRVLYTDQREFQVVVEEQVLRTRVGDAEVMAGQLDWLLAARHAAVTPLARDGEDASAMEQTAGFSSSPGGWA